MNFGLSFVLILVILCIYILMINIFSIMLRVAGVPANIAIFQGISLFTNCGYTTGESETIAASKFRRKVALVCMITGNIFSVIIVSLIVNIISSFSIEKARETYMVALIGTGVVLGFFLIGRIPFVKNWVSRRIQEIVERRIEKNTKDNAITIIDTFMGNSVIEIYLHWVPEALYGKTIHESKIKSRYNINLLSIKRNKRSIQINRNTHLQRNDVILVYGNYADVKALFSIREERAEIEAEIQQNNLVFNEMELIDEYGDQAVVEIKLHVIPMGIEGKTLAESGIKDRFGINIVFLKRDGETIEVNKDTVFKQGDFLIVFGNFGAIKNVFVF